MGDTRYGPVRYALTGDRERARTFLPLARNALLRLQERQRMTKVLSWTDVVDLAPGVACTIRLAGPIASVFVHAVPEAQADVLVRTVPRAELWVPRGFVLYPVSSASELGWGMPPIRTGETFDAENLNPGLDVDRWTVGGRAGQVLLTRVTDAGYPEQGDVVPPLMFHAEVAPQPPKDDDGEFVLNIPPRNTAWAAFRPSFEDYVDVDDAPAEWKREMLELVNEHRASIGREKVLPPIRGYYDSAQASTDQMVKHGVLGHWSEKFDATYRSAWDRLGKDGVLSSIDRTLADSRSYGSSGTGGENLYASGANFNVVGVDPYGMPISEYTPGDMATPEEAMQAWLDSPPHRANIENAQWDEGSSLLVGVRSGGAAQHFVKREAWVAAGNRSWSGSAGPTLSWMSWPMLNLTGETLPIAYNFAALLTDIIAWWSDNGNPIPPSALANTYMSCPVNGMFADSYWPIWVYPISDSSRPEMYASTMDSRVFCRGRAIALAPEGSTVWAAAWQRVDDATTRLIILTHNDDDQPGTWLTHGLTSVVRVWYCDVEDISELVGNPQVVIRGVHGAPTEWPWEDDPDPWSWKGGVAVDVGTTGASRNLLKYTSLWQFSPDGTKAVCLRQHATWQQVESMFRGMYLVDGSLDVFRTGDSRKFTNYPSTALVSLDLQAPSAPSVSFTVINDDAQTVPGSEMSTPFTEAQPFSPSGWERTMWPESVGFSASGTQTVCWRANYYARNYPVSGNARFANVMLAGFSGGTAPAPVDSLVRMAEWPGPPNNTPQNAHVCGTNRDMTFLVLSHRRNAFMFASTPMIGECWRELDVPMHRVSLFVQGQAVSDTNVPSFDGTTPFRAPWCNFYRLGGVVHNLAMPSEVSTTECNYFFPVWGEQGDGEWVASVVVAPQLTGSVWRLIPGAPQAECLKTYGGSSVYPSCLPGLNEAEVLQNEDGLVRKPILVASSFMSSANLATIMGVPGDDFGFLQVRVA